MKKTLNKKEIADIIANGNLRKSLARKDPLWFCLIYLRHHLTYPLAPFHLEMLHLLKNEKYMFIAVMAFRESGKSIILNTANILWSILGQPQKKFAVVVSKTQDQAKTHFNNFKEELMHNELLRADFGPFAEDEREWKKTSLELLYHGSKIVSVSTEQGVRGMKYGALRPDLIICDDIEDISAAQDESARKETLLRFSSEILPLGSSGTRVFVLGNLICQESLLMRLKKDIGERNIDGIFRAYPIIDDERRILWPEKYRDIESVRKLSKRFPEVVWVREFLLKSISANGREIIRPMIFDAAFKHHMGSEERKLPPKQIPLIPQMKEFNISVPYDQAPIYFFMGDPEYKLYFGNVHLNEPMMSCGEREAMLKSKAKEHDGKLKQAVSSDGVL